MIIWPGSARVTARTTAGCGQISTMVPPCPFSVLATINRSAIAAESAERKPDTSIIICRVISDSWEVITPLSCASVLISATPDNTISGPDAPAATDVWSKLTAYTYQLGVGLGAVLVLSTLRLVFPLGEACGGLPRGLRPGFRR